MCGNIDYLSFLVGCALSASFIALVLSLYLYFRAYVWIQRIIPVVVEFEMRKEREKMRKSPNDDDDDSDL